MSEDSPEGVTAEDIEAAREEVIEAMARSAEVYGTKRSYGRLFGLLYFASEPLSLDDLVEESGYAKSTVSTAMSTLERFHLVHRRSVPGEGKRAFFEAEDDFGYVFQQFLDQQVRREIEMMSRALEAASMVLSEAEQEHAQRDLDRVQNLQSTYDHSEMLVDIITSEDSGELENLLDELRGSE